MRRPGFLALFVALYTVTLLADASGEDKASGVFLEVLRSPPNRHVIAMDSMEECLRAARHSNANCVSTQPRLPDASSGTFRSLNWSPTPVAGVVIGDPATALKGKDFGPVYLVVRQSPPNRHVIAMASMKKCLEAAAFSSAKCLEELPRLPDASTGVLRSLDGSTY